MIVHQAMYGAIPKGGHGLIATSGLAELASSVTPHLDLPDTIPAGVVCPAYVTGFQHATHYVLARITLDKKAARAGMVFAHAIFISLQDIFAITNLQPLLAILTSSRKKATTNGIVELTLNVEETQFQATINAVELHNVTNRLVARRPKPVVILDTINFESVITALWATIWPALRAKLAFRLSFSPRDLEENHKLVLVCTPAQLEPLWDDEQIVHSLTQSDTPSLASQLLCGIANAAQLQQFMIDIGAVNLEFRHLRLLEQAFVNVNSTKQQFDSLLSVLRIIEAISPQQDCGVKAKAQLLERFTECIDNSLPITSFQQLRNISLDSMPTYEPYWSKLIYFISNNDYHQKQDANWLDTLKNAFDPNQRFDRWQAVVFEGLTAALRQSQPLIASAIWRWLAIDADSVIKLLMALNDNVHDLENRLVNVSPASLSTQSGESMVTFALSQGWLQLHGAALAGYLCTEDAVQRQFAVDLDKTNSTGLMQSLKLSSASDILSTSYKHDDPRLINIAATEVARSPNILQNADFTNPITWRIWTEAIHLDTSAWRISDTPCACVSVVLDVWLDGGKEAITLIELLSLQPVADLCHYEKRDLVWKNLPNGSVKNSYLNATAAGWIKQSTLQTLPFEPDWQLQQVILQHDIVNTITLLSASHSTIGIAILTMLTEMDSNTTDRCIKTFCQNVVPFDYADANMLGQLIHGRQLTTSLEHIKTLYRGRRQDVKAVLDNCIDMLSFWDKLTLGLQKPSTYDCWRVFEELAIELYSSGPNENELWDRAGGKTYLIDLSGNGQEQWQKALKKVQRGSLPFPYSLLEQMIVDYPKNNKLNWLSTNKSQLAK